MQIKMVNLFALLGVAGTALAADPYSLVDGWPSTDCHGGPTTFSYITKGNSVGCAVTLPPSSGGAASVIGSGCKTYFYSDTNCKNNYFGTGNVVPDTKCYAFVGSYSISC